ncbi:MAG: 30S ribosomal protein S3ae [Candidatus Helarchaeota archaeon]|nr:30S ribosomal protein S3ae [Candidatus Helarchaeota archaeon]
MSPKGKRKGRRKVQTIDKWKNKTWYSVHTPKYFGDVEIAQIPTSSDVLGRTVETTLYNITNDYSQTHIKMFFKIKKVDENYHAYTKFWGHDFTRDYLRSLVRRTTSQIKGIFNISIKADSSASSGAYKIRVTAVVFTQKRAKTSQQKAIRLIMKNIIEEKSHQLNFIAFIQECVLGKIGSEIYNEAKIIFPIRKSEIMKTKIVLEPAELPSEN